MKSEPKARTAVQIASGAAAKVAATRAALAADNRARAPLMSAWIDEMRAHFPDLRVTYVQEGEFVAGKRGQEGVIPNLITERRIKA